MKTPKNKLRYHKNQRIQSLEKNKTQIKEDIKIKLINFILKANQHKTQTNKISIKSHHKTSLLSFFSFLLEVTLYRT